MTAAVASTSRESRMETASSLTTKTSFLLPSVTQMTYSAASMFPCVNS